MVDPIADMLTRIRNANAVGKMVVDVPYSKTKHAVADVLSAHGFLANVAVNEEGRKALQLELADPRNHGGITEIHRVSKPGRRVYVSRDDIPNVLRGRGLVVVSTSSGVMSGAEARKKGVGGELICKVW